MAGTAPRSPGRPCRRFRPPSPRLQPETSAKAPATGMSEPRPRPRGRGDLHGLRDVGDSRASEVARDPGGRCGRSRGKRCSREVHPRAGSNNSYFEPWHPRTALTPRRGTAVPTPRPRTSPPRSSAPCPPRRRSGAPRRPGVPGAVNSCCRNIPGSPGAVSMWSSTPSGAEPTVRAVRPGRRGGVPVRVPGRRGGHRSSPGRSRPGRVLWSDAGECAYAAVAGPGPYATDTSLAAVSVHDFGPFGGRGEQYDQRRERLSARPGRPPDGR